MSVQYRGAELPIEDFTRIPSGTGSGLVLDTYNPNQGILPGQVAVLFLTGRSEGTGDDEVGVPCPVPSAVPDAALDGTGVGDSFRITTDVPVVAYQVKPYGGGRVALTGATLLIPTSAWSTDYVAVQSAAEASGFPSMNIVARDDNTVLSITPTASIEPGPGVPGVGANQIMQIELQRGQQLQITQPSELTGSIVSANRPIGLMAGHECMNVPLDTDYCDHGEQMVPPVTALGNRFAGVMYRPRVPHETTTFWRLIGVADGTRLTYSTDVGGPSSLDLGESKTFSTGTPFEVSSQDAQHPFILFTYMTGSKFVEEGYGDPDFVLVVPPTQYLQHYVFYTDPTYPETSLVVVRSRGIDGEFKDVTLDCAGALDGWQSITTDLEFTRRTVST
ncbi:MAG: hypothetical protein EOP84_31610, partial [Verrucomicrobiaceae bacterium]